MVAVALVTGANKGIGLEIARGLADLGITAIIGARDEERGRAAAERLGQPYLQLDVTDGTSIDAAAEQISEQYGKLDILVNNAGVMIPDGPPSATSLDDARRVYETNVFGVIAVTNALLPLLRSSPTARIVNLSSERGSIGRALDTAHPLWNLHNLAYTSAKAALNMITVSYARELWDTPVKVIAVDPGWCATDINGGAGYRTAAQGAAVAVRAATGDVAGGTFLHDDGFLPW